MISPKLQALMLGLLAEGRISINEARSINLEIEGGSTPPEGYVLVPVEPTDEMLMADAGAIPSRASLWRAMIAARPEVSGG